MANIVYPLIILLFIFGAFSTYINDTGWYSQKVPESGLYENTSGSQQFNTALTETSKSSGFNSVEIIYMLGKCILGGILGIITIGPLLSLLVALGVDQAFAMVILSPLGIILIFWVFEMVTGRVVD